MKSPSVTPSNFNSAAAKGEKDLEAPSVHATDPVAGKSVAEIFGEIVWLMSQDKKARELPIRDLERLVMPPILLKQFHITYATVSDGKTVKGEDVRSVGSVDAHRLQPISVELYAMCSDIVAAALDTTGVSEFNLTFQDWRSGTIKRIALACKAEF